MNNLLAKLKSTIKDNNLKISDFIELSKQLLENSNKTTLVKDDNFIIIISDFHAQVLELCDSDKIKFQDCYSYNLLVKKYQYGILTHRQVKQWHQKYYKLEFLNLLKKTNKINTIKTRELVQDINFYIKKINLYELSDKQQQQLFSILDYLRVNLLSQADSYQDKLTFKKILKIVNDKLNYQTRISQQKFCLEINPLDENFNIVKPQFSNNQKIGEHFGGLKLTNLNIDKVCLDVNGFGFNAKIDINLVIDSETFHQQYLFLYHNKPLSILLTLQQQYKFKIAPKKKENFTESLVYHGISCPQDSGIEFCEIAPLKYDDPKTKQQKETLVYKLKLSYQFCDPLQAFLKQQHPLRVAQKISYAEIIKELLSPFSQWIQIDTKLAKILQQSKSQIFVMASQADKRSAYDILMESLDFYQLGLQCDYTSKYKLDPVNKNNNQKITLKQVTNYIVYNNTNSLPSIQKEKIPAAAINMSLWHLDNIQVKVNNTVKYESKQINADAKLLSKDSLYEKQEYNKDSKLPTSNNIKSVLDEYLVNYSDTKIYDNLLHSKQKSFTTKHLCHSDLTIKYNQWPLLDLCYPYPVAIDLPEYTKTITNQYAEEFCISGYSIEIQLTDSSKKLAQEQANLIADDPDQVAKDPKKIKEKISYANVLEVTHAIKVEQNLTDKRLYPRYASYNKFVPITIKGIIYTHKEVDDKNKYEYFTLKDTKESAISVDESSHAQEISRQDYSEGSVVYSLKINPAFAFKKPQDHQAFCIFFPVQETQLLPHSYLPYANGDMVELEILNAESVKFSRAISNRLESLDICSKEFRQEHGYGLQQEAHIAYIKEQDVDQLELQQLRDDQNGLNQISLSKKDGLTLYYSNKK